MKKLILLFTLLCFVSIGKVFSQCALIELSLENRISNSSLIVEGKVVSTESFWNEAKSNIFTSNKIEVYKVLKGNYASPFLTLITEGGRVGDVIEKIDPSLKLAEGAAGIFMCYENNLIGLANPHPEQLYRPYADLQGFIRYDLFEKFAYDPFKKYRNPEQELFKKIKSVSGSSPIFTKQASLFSLNPGAGTPANMALPPSITSFSPSSISAGTFSVLTINGSGFGATQGSSTVQFFDSDNGGSSYTALGISSTVTWSNTQIVVKLETGEASPGTGNIRVATGTGTVTSTGILTVTYSEMNVFSSSTNWQTTHIDRSGNGGLIWQRHTSFAGNANANTAFNRAFERWRCKTHINWSVGANTSVNVASNDNTNVIRFDVGAELPSGTLGRCSSYWSGCSGGGTSEWYVEELDIVFNDATNWYYLTGTPGGSQSDFESVALHELGHGHQFNHVINNNDVMHYALTTGTSNRYLNSNNVACGLDIMSRSVVDDPCSQTNMIALTNCTCQLTTPTFVNAGANTTICNGDNLTLGSTSITGHTYSWSPTTGLSSGTISNPVATPSISTTYTLTEIDTLSNCANIDPVSVTIGSSFTTNAGNDATVCGSGSVNLGGPPFPGRTYSWSPTTGLSSSTSSAPTATVTTTTTYTLTETQTSNACQNTDVVTITYGANFTANAGADVTICSGASATIGAPSTAGFTYSWSPSTGLSSSTLSNPVATPSTTTTYTLTKTQSSTSCTKTDVVIVTAQPAFTANAGADVSLCGGSSTTLGTSSASGITYSWNPTTGLSSGSISNPVATPSVTTNYTLTATQTSTSCIKTDVVAVTVAPAGTAAFTASPLSGVAPLLVTFGDQSTNAVNWSWDIDNNGSNEYSTQNPSHTYAAAGVYSVVLKINSNCFTVTKTNYITVASNPSGIVENENENAVVKVFPNPFSDKTRIQLSQIESLPNSKLVFTIYDVLGKTIMVKELTKSEAMNGFEIQKAGFAEAIYYFKFIQGDAFVAGGNFIVE